MVGAYFTLSLGGHIVADSLVKPIELAVPAGEVGQGPAKQPDQPVQRTIVGPVSLHPALRVSPAKPNLIAKPDIDIELAEIRRAWRAYQSTNSRVAVYIYLLSVFAAIMRWRRLNCAQRKSRAALRLRPIPPQMKPEPFAIVIFCTADPMIFPTTSTSSGTGCRQGATFLLTLRPEANGPESCDIQLKPSLRVSA
jgi:hypothetical protein